MVAAFSFGQVSRLAGVKARTLDHWAATGFLVPSIKRATGTGTRRVYSFSDVVAARVASDLRSAGASLQGLRKVVKELRKREFAQSLADVRLIVSHKDAYLVNNLDFISVLQHPGQLHFPITILDLGATVNQLRSEAQNIVEPPSTELTASVTTFARDVVINAGMGGPFSVRRRPRQVPLAFARDNRKTPPESSPLVRAEGGERETNMPAKKPSRNAGISAADGRDSAANTRRKA